MTAKIIRYILIVCGILTMAVTGYLSVLLRDGLGPDMIESAGFDAFIRVFEMAWPGSVIGLLVFLAGLMIKSIGR